MTDTLQSLQVSVQLAAIKNCETDEFGFPKFPLLWDVWFKHTLFQDTPKMDWARQNATTLIPKRCSTLSLMLFIDTWSQQGHFAWYTWHHTLSDHKSPDCWIKLMLHLSLASSIFCGNKLCLNQISRSYTRKHRKWTVNLVIVNCHSNLLQRFVWVFWGDMISCGYLCVIWYQWVFQTPFKFLQHSPRQVWLQIYYPWLLCTINSIQPKNILSASYLYPSFNS